MSAQQKKYSLCECRHEVPPDCAGSIYTHKVNLNDLPALEDIADKVVCQCKCDGCELHVYVTGIQAPLVALINSANRRKVKLVLWHWNPTTQQYYAQNVYQGGEDEQ